MKNINIWRQSKFFGGKNVTDPSTQIEAEQVEDILNLLPNSDGSELKLRTGFIPVPWAVSDAATSYAQTMSVLACAPAAPTGVYQSEGLIRAHTVPNGANFDLKLYVSTPTGQFPLNANIAEEQIWASGGDVPPAVIKTPTPIVDVAPVADAIYWEDAAARVYTTPLGTKFYGVRDYWVDDLGKFSVKNLFPGNNVSLWISEDASLDMPLASDTTFLTDWITGGNVAFDTYIPADTWYQATPGAAVLSEVSGTGLCFKAPTYFVDTPISGTTLQTEPVLSYPTIMFTVSLAEYPRDINFLFRYDSGSFLDGASANVYVRDATKPESVFEQVNVKGVTPTPIRFMNQASITNANERWTGTGALAAFIVCTKRITGYKDVQVKIEVRPGMDATRCFDQDAGGIFAGFLVGTAA